MEPRKQTRQSVNPIKKLIAILIGCTALALIGILWSYDIPNNTFIEHPIETVEFITQSETNNPDMFIKTDRENIVTSSGLVRFVKVPNNETFILDETVYGSPMGAFKDNPYVIYVPENQANALSASYLKAFGKELPFTTPGKEE